ncbi:16S rRNA (guanine(527)-N(7))-methyltransferase RsmG [Halocynthiibacter sp. C4]|uniref:16S rRNA (guanine(527)-N(7))-methyltransferase RsmG n=1 Tax=Halocynthiibacter sp. C4 TaxID=2992758 RepID=UPI00237B4D3E|nr:16S rRNA (guanine(527)-N(7))-methyltransferase RsmG [Halocynthiibacter sp. C4]MDE0591000.1 16S rRNA (guanine(527)-N(7))-methyltransferase RsmG [Halocynthiibacter sp. C4]
MSANPVSVEAYLDDVSRETVERLEVYAELVKKWNPRINLVSKSTLSDLWSRHIVDSIQVFQLAPRITHWLDLGSGGGFPGAVAAILGAEKTPEAKFTLVESDQRKCAFLRTVSRETGAKFTVLTERIETLEPQRADVISARALASLNQLFEFSKRHGVEGTVSIFPKGAKVQQEIKEAQQNWKFELEEFPSATDTDARILRIGNIIHV